MFIRIQTRMTFIIIHLIFNYNKVVKGDDRLADCKCHEFPTFINSDCGHVITRDVTLVKNDDLRNTLLKGPAYINMV